MTELDHAVLYRGATIRAIEVARAIRPEQLDDPTPCSEWSVQDLLEHLVGGTRYLGAALGGEVTEELSPGTAEHFASGVAGCLDRLEDPASLEHRSLSPLGFEWSGAEAAAGTFMDVLVHTWDLATATGQDPHLDPALVEACIAIFLPDTPERGRAAGLVGPAIDVPADASPQDRLLAAMGRRP